MTGTPCWWAASAKAHGAGEEYGQTARDGEGVPSGAAEELGHDLGRGRRAEDPDAHPM
jgi:hypothetical protein